MENSTNVTLLPNESSSANEACAVPARQENPTAVFDMSKEVFTQALQNREKNRQIMLDWIKATLKKGIDFDQIPIRGKLSKEFLTKPGAEKIAGMLGLIVRYPNLKQYENAVLSSSASNMEMVILKCELWLNGVLVAEGTGARHRLQDEVPANQKLNRAAFWDINKSLKMAEKSAMIDAVLRCAGISELFTQDLDDMPHLHENSADNGDSAPAQRPQQGENRYKAAKTISDKQHRRLEALINQACKQHDINKESFRLRLKKWFNQLPDCQGLHLNAMPRQHYDMVCNKLEEFATKMAAEQPPKPKPKYVQDDPYFRGDYDDGPGGDVRREAHYNAYHYGRAKYGG